METNVQLHVMSIVMMMKFSALEEATQMDVQCLTFVLQRNIPMMECVLKIVQPHVVLMTWSVLVV